ncbi:MAG TPA: VOC family protein [Acidimicrobiales bacterium]|nr:VOC family protein [Acidimicrobiales bacterium]
MSSRDHDRDRHDLGSDRLVTQLGYFVLSVSDEAEWLTFATEVLGMAVGGRSDSGAVELRMDDHAYRVVLEATGDDDVAAVGWQVATPAHLDELEKRLGDAGIEIEQRDGPLAAERRVGGVLRFRDPSGLAVEAYWGPELIAGQPFVPGRPISGFTTGTLGVGHVVLAVDDVAATVAFYRRTLGFELTDFGNGPFTFLRCNPRHHSIAFGPAGKVVSDKRLLHFMVEMDEVDDVGTAHDLCLSRGIPIAISLGRHTNDRMFSFYARTPSGFRFECGHGGLLVGDDWFVPRYRDREVWGHRRLEETLRPTDEDAPTAGEPTP